MVLLSLHTTSTLKNPWVKQRKLEWPNFFVYDDYQSYNRKTHEEKKKVLSQIIEIVPTKLYDNNQLSLYAINAKKSLYWTKNR